MPSLRCTRCGHEIPLDDERLLVPRCPRCGGVLEIVGEEPVWRPRGSGLARYSSMLAIKPVMYRGEGGTQLVIEEHRGLRLWFKLEYTNPSGSFKDRGSVLALSHASMLGARCVAEDSSGNAGLAVARTARIHGLEALIIVPRDAPGGKKRAIRLLGARLVEAETRAAAASLAPKLAREENCYYVYHLGNPFFLQGLETIAYEAYEQEGVPDAVIAPFGSGGLLLGIARGFEKLRSLGLARKQPVMIAVQGVDVHPLYDAVHGPIAASGSSRLADGIRVPSPPLLSQGARIVRETGGRVVLVSDEEITSALRGLVDRGFIVEPTSATVLAALDKIIDWLKERGVRDVLLPLTGSGLKVLDELVELLGA